MNFSGLADPQLDLLLEALASEYDPSQLPGRAKAAEDRWMALHPMLPLFSDLQQVALSRSRFQKPESAAQPYGLTLRDLVWPETVLEQNAVELRMMMPKE